MPLQNLLVSEAHQRLMQSGDPEVVPMPVGQIVGRMNEVRPVAEVMADLLAEAADVATLTATRLGAAPARPHPAAACPYLLSSD